MFGKIDPLIAAKEVFKEKYAKALIGFAAGSVFNGTGNKYSDIDFVLVFEKLPNAYRESFVYKDWPIEVFIHDKETLKYFFEEFDRNDGCPALANMIYEGKPIPEENNLSIELKNYAKQILDDGPPTWGDETIKHQRYMLTDILDDLREPKSFTEAVATGAYLYERLANFYFRSQNKWSAERKHIPRKIKEINNNLVIEYNEAFEMLFKTGKVDKVISLSEAILKPYGGILFDGYKRQAPSNWRKVLTKGNVL